MRFRTPMSLWKAPHLPNVSPNGSAGPQPLILLYHSVQRVHIDPWGVRVSPRNFNEQMAVLAAHAQPMRLRDLDSALEGGDIPPRSVIVTFDDGYADNLHNARPVLQRYNIPATVFIATGYVGSSC